MRILIVHDQLARVDGAERYVQGIASALAERGFEPMCLTASDQEALWARGGIYKIPASEGWRSGRKRLGELHSVLAASNPDLVFVNNTKWFLSPLLLDTVVRRAPSILFVHDVRMICPNQTKIIRASRAPCLQPVGLACLRGRCCRLGNQSFAEAWRHWAIARWRLAVCRRFGRVIAPSHYMAEELIRNGIPAQRVVVLPLFTRRRRSTRPVEVDTDLLWVGRFDGAKGFEMFAEMLLSLIDLPWRAAVVGGGEGLTQARMLIDRLGLTPRVSFLGCLNDAEMDMWYARTRVVVVTPVLAESFCMVGIEAMAHARPVVAFDVGGIREWLVDGSTGFAVPLADVRSLAAAVRRLLTEPALAKGLGEAGRALVDARFRLPRHLNSLASTFESVRREWNSNHRPADATGCRV